MLPVAGTTFPICKHAHLTNAIMLAMAGLYVCQAHALVQINPISSGTKSPLRTQEIVHDYDSFRVCLCACMFFCVCVCVYKHKSICSATCPGGREGSLRDARLCTPHCSPTGMAGRQAGGRHTGDSCSRISPPVQ